MDRVLFLLIFKRYNIRAGGWGFIFSFIRNIAYELGVGGLYFHCFCGHF